MSDFWKTYNRPVRGGSNEEFDQLMRKAEIEGLGMTAAQGLSAMMKPAATANEAISIAGETAGVLGKAAAPGLKAAAAVAGGLIIGNRPVISKTGDISAEVGSMGLQQPFLLVKRKQSYYPSNDKLGKVHGYPAYTMCKLSNCKGFTVVQEVILNVSATEDEKNEIESLLKKGVYL